MSLATLEKEINHIVKLMAETRAFYTTPYIELDKDKRVAKSGVKWISDDMEEQYALFETYLSYLKTKLYLQRIDDAKQNTTALYRAAANE